MRIGASLLILFFFALACQPKVEKQLSKASADFNWEYRRGACFGTCPVYDFRFDGQGRASFQGKHHVAFVGDTSFQLSPAEVQAFRELLLEEQFLALDSSYLNEYIADLAERQLRLSLPGVGFQKSVRVQWEAPPNLLRIEEAVQELLRPRALLMSR